MNLKIINRLEMKMATIEDFIGHAVDKDYAKAGETFNDLMADKMQAALDQEKIKVGGIIYNGLNPEDFDTDAEEQLELDLDQEENQDEDLLASEEEAIEQPEEEPQEEEVAETEHKEDEEVEEVA